MAILKFVSFNPFIHLPSNVSRNTHWKDCPLSQTSAYNRNNLIHVTSLTKHFVLLFPPAQVFYILSRCSYYRDECADKDKKGIKRLLNNGTYTAAFPLHDVSFVWGTFALLSSSDTNSETSAFSDRNILLETMLDLALSVLIVFE